MESLPADQVRPNPAFHTTGVDFCGPFYYKSKIRSRPPIRCYIAVFICFSSKATHLEIVRDLSTESFLAALKRFISLRLIWLFGQTTPNTSSELKTNLRIFDNYFSAIPTRQPYRISVFQMESIGSSSLLAHLTSRVCGRPLWPICGSYSFDARKKMLTRLQRSSLLYPLLVE